MQNPDPPKTKKPLPPPNPPRPLVGGEGHGYFMLHAMLLRAIKLIVDLPSKGML